LASKPAQASGSITNVSNRDPNWQMGYIGSRTRWNITSQFYMGVDVIYTKLYRDVYRESRQNGSAAVRARGRRAA
jgi:hypothetical protein